MGICEDGIDRVFQTYGVIPANRSQMLAELLAQFVKLGPSANLAITAQLLERLLDLAGQSLPFRLEANSAAGQDF